MNKILKFLILAFISLNCINCGGSGDDGDDVGACSNLKIVNGDVCESKRNPVVKLYMYKDGVYQGSCSGSIITRTSVLTAAHCIYKYNKIEVHHRNAIETVREAFYHGSYIGGVTTHDVAIVKVSTAFTDAANFKPLAIDMSHNIEIGQTLVAYGFGLDENGQESVYYPKATYVTLVGLNNITSMITTQGLTGYANLGDSGGPLAYKNGIVGVLSGKSNSGGINYWTYLRETSNHYFIMRLAGDVEQKHNIVGEEDYSDIAIKWTPSE